MVLMYSCRLYEYNSILQFYNRIFEMIYYDIMMMKVDFMIIRLIIFGIDVCYQDQVGFWFNILMNIVFIMINIVYNVQE